MIHRHFEEQITECKNKIVEMGKTAEIMLEKSIQNLLTRETDQHDFVFEKENRVDALQIEIDELVINILALQHPMASDLRLVLMCSKIASELERIGDQAVNICQNTAEMLKHTQIKSEIQIIKMTDITKRMLRDSLDAFIKQDEDLAQTILETDSEVDALKHQIFTDLSNYMMTDPTIVPGAMAFILMARNIERVADHATNIAEEVIYVTQGRDVRHKNN